MGNPEIATPFALFIDEGVNIFDSVVEAERSFEPQDVSRKPYYAAYDSMFRGYVGYDSLGRCLRIEAVKVDHPWG